MKTDFKIRCAETWREVAPQAGAPDLLLEKEGRLVHLHSDFKAVHDYGAVGPVDCPIAYDPVRRLAFRYVCASGYQRGDFSQLRAFSIDRGESFALKELSLNQWALWMLEWIAPSAEASGQLFGLLASDRQSEDQIVIEHQLFSYQPGEAQVRRRLLCRDAYKPLAFSRRRRELVFAGADGVYLLNLRGERKLSLSAESAASGQTGQGAAFCPQGSPRVVLGGDGLHLWDLERNTSLRLTRNGRHPVWAPDGRGIWYRESSADLHYYDFEQDQTQKIIGSTSQRHPEFWHARPVGLSACGRYLASSISEKVLRGVSAKGNATGERERVYVHHHKLLILDLKARVFWQQAGFANHLRWVD
jgi:hypothetical protein